MTKLEAMALLRYLYDEGIIADFNMFIDEVEKRVEDYIDMNPQPAPAAKEEGEG